MTEDEYRVIEPAKPEFEPRALLVVPHNEKPLTVSRFGRNNYNANQQEMQRNFSCLPQYTQVSFKPATTSESVSIAAHTFEDLTKPQIIDSPFLQLGYIGKTQEGVFLNLPRDNQGNLIINEQILKSYLNRTESIEVGKGKVWIVQNEGNLRDLAFVEYDTFETGVQESRVFTEGGLARGLEHTKRKPKNLEKISNPEFYKLGINVLGFDSTDELVVRVAVLGSDRLLDGVRLYVSGGWNDYDHGYAFGVLNQSAEGP